MMVYSRDVQKVAVLDVMMVDLLVVRTVGSMDGMMVD